MDYFSLGRLDACKLIGITKFSKQFIKLSEDLSTQDLLQGAAVGGAAALPFAGMIGNKSLINDPLLGRKGQQFKTLEELTRAAKPGDVVLTAKPKGSIWRNFQLPITGSEFYHGTGVVGRREPRKLKFRELLSLENAAPDMIEDLTGHSLDEIAFMDPSEMREHLDTINKEFGKPKTYTVESGAPGLRDLEDLREGLANKSISPESLGASDEGVQELTNALRTNKYEDVALLRPRTPMTPEQLEVFQRSMLERGTRPYSNLKAIEVYLKDLFLPKIKGLTDKGQQVVCEGNVCSTMPAQAYAEATGKSVISGKRPQDIAPADYLRSPDFELVGSRLNREQFKLSPTTRKLLPWATRGAIGAGMAGGVYAGTEHPEAGGALVGGVGGLAAAPKVKKLLQQRTKVPEAKLEQRFPDLFDVTRSVMDSGVPIKDRINVVKPMLKGTVPLALAGAGLGALGGAGLSHLNDRIFGSKKGY